MPQTPGNDEFENVPLDYLSSNKQIVMSVASTVSSKPIPTKDELASRANKLSAGICEAETMMLGMTESQKAEMHNRKDKDCYKEQSAAEQSLRRCPIMHKVQDTMLLPIM